MPGTPLNESRPIFKLTAPFLLACVAFLLTPLTASHAASELVLSREFQVSALHNMPGPDSHPGLQFQQTNHLEKKAFEWQVQLQAPAGQESPLYQNVNSANFSVRFPSTKGVIIHWNLGSHSQTTDFQPQSKALAVSEPFLLESFGGRSSDGVMPYFNLATDEGELIFAVGWSGDWRASFTLKPNGKIQITAGLKRSRFKLDREEHVRLPSVLAMSYRGPWIDGQNQFRRLMLNHFTPPGRAPMTLMPVAASVHGLLGFNLTTEKNLTLLADHIATLKLPINTFWLDAGWNEGGFPGGQGNPNADPIRFPRGLTPVGKAVREKGMKFLAWFEPERVMRGSWLDREHPDWLLSPSNTPAELRYLEKDGFRLLDLGNPAARRWAIDHISQQLREADISIYRQDFNQYPAFFWHTDERPNEVGLREIRYVNGLYDFLDTLARRHPELIIDNCASGGRRLDFELMRRSVVLWRSDSCWGDNSFPRNVQAMTHGLSHWLPLHGLGAHTTDQIALRSGMGTCGSFPVNFHNPDAVTALSRHLKRYLKVRALFSADFYPLTKWSDAPTDWLGFQFHDSAKEEGIIQLFCGPNPTQQTYELKPQALNANKIYTITNWDSPNAVINLSGDQLSRSGIRFSGRNVNQAIVLHYKSHAHTAK